MDKRKTAALTVPITCLLVLAVLFAFGNTLFLETPDILLPPVEDQGQGTARPEDGASESPGVLRVRITPETVQAVIQMLNRPESYSRAVRMEYFWGGEGKGGALAQVWVNRDRTRVRMELDGGRVRNVITDGVRSCVWEEGEQSWRELPAGVNAGDREQRIPTYEDVLAVDPEKILSAGYVALAEIDCIFVEIEETLFGYMERYWISVETGLLVCSETWENGQLAYFMSSFEATIPGESENAFLLPDGTEFSANASVREK